MKKIAAIAADAPIGKEGITALEAAAKLNGLEIVTIARVAADLKNLDESAAAIAKAKPDAVLILAPAGPGIKFTEALKKNKVTAQLAGLSVMSNTALYKAVADQAQGMIITQVVPFPWSPKFVMTADYQKLMAEKNITVWQYFKDNCGAWWLEFPDQFALLVQFNKPVRTFAIFSEQQAVTNRLG